MSLVLVNCLGHTLAMKSGRVTNNTLLRKNNFPFYSRYQLQIVFWLDMVACVIFPLSVLEFCLV